MLNFNKNKTSEHRLSDQEITNLLNRAALLEGENTRLREAAAKNQTKLTYAETMVKYHSAMAEANLKARVSLEAEVKRLSAEVEVSHEKPQAASEVAKPEVALATSEDSILDESRDAYERMSSGDELPEINLSPGDVLRPPTM